MDGAKSEMASPTVTQVPSVPRDPADQLTGPQSTAADMELTERWMNGLMDDVSCAAWLFRVTALSFSEASQKQRRHLTGVRLCPNVTFTHSKLPLMVSTL